MNELLELPSGAPNPTESPTHRQLAGMRLTLAVVAVVSILVAAWAVMASGAAYAALPELPRWSCAAPLQPEADAISELMGVQISPDAIRVRTEGGYRLAAVRSPEGVAVVELSRDGRSFTAVPADNTAEFLSGTGRPGALPAVGAGIGDTTRACLG